jgi:hypothetical protein
MDIENEGLIELAIEGRTFQNGVGWIDLNRDSLLQGVENFYNRPAEARDLPIKYGTHDAGTDAAGWIKAMMPTERKGRMVVMALVQWTKQGRKAVKEQLQRFISPEFFETWRNKETGKNQGFTFTGAALVNDPQLESLRPAFALSQGNTPFAHFFANANMPNQGNNMAKTKASETEIEIETPDAGGGLEPTEPAPAVPTGKTFADTVKEIMTVPADTTEADLIEMLKAKLQLACDYEAMKQSGAQAVAMSQSAAAEAEAKAKKLSQTVDEQAAKLQALTATVKQAEAEKWVDGFMLSATNRRLIPAQRETFVQLYLTDPKAAQSVVDTLPVLSALGQSTGVGGKVEDETLDARRDVAYKHALSQNKTPAEAAKLAAQITE